ncbi:RICIN domain-containing protein [Kitasatospora sp. MMS16-BH015]|uniref:RICIN domain-containing protein n=1 Tax=Kitasatospora sp. MMS16-BH015 TaxID=2018025 RepID=UPI000CF22022|nr:RICIN domain-containing protein [Kitasatospora sp. MMS16-BH015]
MRARRALALTTAVFSVALTSLVGVGAGTASADTPVGTFRLKNYGWGNYCVAATGGIGARTALAPCADTASQKWTIYPVGGAGESGTWYVAVNAGNGLCLDGDVHNLTGGAAVQTWSCNNNTNQRWGFTMNLNYTQHIKNLDAYTDGWNSRFLLDMDTNLQRLWADNGANNQYWAWI